MDKTIEKINEKIHANALLELLNKKNPCSYCPYDGGIQRCHRCAKFLNAAFGCPCHILGKKEAIKRTWIALEEKGYI